MYLSLSLYLPLSLIYIYIYIYCFKAELRIRDMMQAPLCLFMLTSTSKYKSAMVCKLSCLFSLT